MKKLAVILMTSFYLLLTTGQFACIVNCSPKWLISAIGTSGHETHQEAGNCHQASKKDKHCDGKKGCPCCEKHGSYLVKENLKPDVDYFASNLPVIPVNTTYTNCYINKSIIKGEKAHQNNAPPPGNTGPNIHIRICTFLI